EPREVSGLLQYRCPLTRAMVPRSSLVGPLAAERTASNADIPASAAMATPSANHALTRKAGRSRSTVITCPPPETALARACFPRGPRTRRSVLPQETARYRARPG